MAFIRSSKLNLPNPSLSPSSPQVSSVLYEPISSSLALTLSDSSISLYPSLSPLSTPSLSYPQTLIPSPCSSSSFLLLRSSSSQQNPNSSPPPPRVFFVVAGPYRGGSRLLLRFYGLREGFTRVTKVICDQKGIEFDSKVGVLLDLSHGVSVKIFGSTNYFAVYCVSSSKILIFGVKIVNEEDDGGDGSVVVVKLIRCCVVDCVKPVCSIGIFSGLLILGEDNGVKVLNLRELVKGKSKKSMMVVNKKNKNENPVLANKRSLLSKQRQESSETTKTWCFVPFQQNSADEVGTDDKKSEKDCIVMSVKAISIQALSIKRFLILDSLGNVYVLHVSVRRQHPSLGGSNFVCHMQQLPRFMDVQKLALLPEISIGGMKSFWISDGDYTVHRVTVSVDEEKDEVNKIKEEKPIHSSDFGVVTTTHAIFAPEKIHDLVPFSENGVLILGLRSLYAYAIS